MNCPHCGKKIERRNTPSNLSERDVALFWGHVSKTESCWNFTGSPTAVYGRIKIQGKSYMAHAVSWVIHGRALEAGKIIAHECDNPRCVRPDHLVLKTQIENMDDMVSRKRNKPMRGESNPWSKISDSDIEVILESLRSKTKTIKELAKERGVTYNCIWQIAVGHTRGSKPVIIPSVQKKLSFDDVVEIRRLCASGLSQTAVALRYRVNPATISNICSGKKRRDVPMPAAIAA